MNLTARRLAALCALLTVLALSPLARAEERFIVLASTTSTEQSGLFRHLLPAFTRSSGIEVRVVAVGTGQALDLGRRGDADVVFVHDSTAEERFVAEGWSEKRYPVMYNDFILVGPRSDPARASGNDIVAGLRQVAAAAQPFVSRGDRSGTHAAELRLWKLAGVEVAASKPSGYRECGCGMGPALNMGSALGAYVLADRGTWLAFRNRGEMAILVEGDKKLFNQYGVMLVNPARHPHVKKELGQRLIDWLLSPAGQAAIAGYQIDGQPLFFPNAR